MSIHQAFKTVSGEEAFNYFQGNQVSGEVRDRKFGECEAIQVLTGTVDASDAVSVKGRLKGCQIAAQSQTKNAEKSKKNARDLLDVLQSIRRDLQKFEAGIAKDYGEDFAIDLLEELDAMGLVDQAELDRIRALQDVNKQREAMAELAQRLIEEGKIDPEQLADLHEKLPWLQEWLQKHEEAKAKIYQEHLDRKEGRVEIADISNDAQNLIERGVDLDEATRAKEASLERFVQKSVEPNEYQELVLARELGALNLGPG